MSVNIQAAVQANVLGNNLMGMISKTTERGLEFLIMPSPTADSTPITAENVCAEINRLIFSWNGGEGEAPKDDPVNPEAVKKAMSIVGLEEAALSFDQLFVYYTKPAGEGAVANTEYAIGIHLQGKPVAEGFSFLTINEAYINVWDTPHKSVLKDMKIWTPDQLSLT